MIGQLLMVDYNMRFDFDKILKHIWFEKDMRMKQKVNDIIAEVPKILKLSDINSNKIITKKIKFCSCLTHDIASNLHCT